jgi:hypothetical protein
VQIARASGADRATVGACLERREAPAGLHVQRLTELVAFVQEMAPNVRGDVLAGWLGAVEVLGGANPLDEIAGAALRAPLLRRWSVQHVR